MRADLSRDTFDASKQYAAVVLQQGRVLLDADFNEQVEIDRAQDQVADRDTVGVSGSPRDGGGFAVAPTADGADLTISPGHFHVGGLVVDNDPQRTTGTATSPTVLSLARSTLDGRVVGTGDVLVVGLAAGPAPVTVSGVSGSQVTTSAAHGVAVGASVAVWRRVSVSRQPFVWASRAAAGGSPLTVDGSALTAGRYVAALRTSVRDLSAVDDPDLPEPALGGPDTSLRRRRVWQVLVAKVKGGGSCADWTAPTSAVRLQPVLTPPAADTGDCTLPADSAYQGIVNSLYRVEVNSVDPVSGAATSVVWDRDNASTVSLIETVGTVLTLSTFGPDPTRGFATAPLVTVTDQHRELDGAPQQVRTPSNPHLDSRTLQVDSPPVVDADALPRVRRWCGQAAVTAGELIPLELGLSVVLDGGPARVGDHWLIPARTALGGTGGGIDWPSDDTGYRAQPAAGAQEQWAPLAVLDLGATGWTAPARSDCRRIFPSLTTITADDVSYDDSPVDLGAATVQEAIEVLASRTGGCTIMLEAGPNWAAPLLALPDGLDARVCFRAGTFASDLRVVVANKGHLVLEGVGIGTVVRAARDEVALQLDHCAGVTVRDMAFSSNGSQGSQVRLGGALDITSCPQVVIENVVAGCTSAGGPVGTCITVAGTVDATKTDPAAASATATDAAYGAALPTRVVVRDCTLMPGEYQIGLAVRDVAHCDVSGVVVQPPPTAFTSVLTMPSWLRQRFSSTLLSQLKLAAAPTPGPAPAPGPAATPAAASAAKKATTAASAAKKATTTAPVTPAKKATTKKASAAAEAHPAPAATTVIGPGGGLASAPIHTLARPSGTLETISAGGLTFTSPGRLAQGWRDALKANPAPTTTPAATTTHLRSLVDAVLRPQAVVAVAALRASLDVAVQARIPPIYQGIVISGSYLGTVVVRQCRIQQAIMGIHVAVSHREPAKGAPLYATRVEVADNIIGVLLPSEGARSRHGVFVGNTRSLLVADNIITFTKQALADVVDSAAIRVGGYLGSEAVIRDNHLTGFPVGVGLLVYGDPAAGLKQVRWVLRGTFGEGLTSLIKPVYRATGNFVFILSDNIPAA